MRVDLQRSTALNIIAGYLDAVFMDSIKVQVKCRDCGSERTLEPSSPIIPLVDGSSCLSDGAESTSRRCACGCEAFHVIRIIK